MCVCMQSVWIFSTISMFVHTIYITIHSQWVNWLIAHFDLPFRYTFNSPSTLRLFTFHFRRSLPLVCIVSCWVSKCWLVYFELNLESTLDDVLNEVSRFYHFSSFKQKAIRHGHYIKLTICAFFRIRVMGQILLLFYFFLFIFSDSHWLNLF